MDEMKTILDYAPYYEGRTHIPTTKKRPILSIEDAMAFGEKVLSDPVAEQLFQSCERSSDFFSMHIDARTWVPTVLQSEAFYTLKNGEFCSEVSAYCVYILKKAWAECEGIPNLISKILPKKDLTMFFTEGVVCGEYNLQDVVSTVINDDFMPLSVVKKKVRHSTYSEVYVADTDMVAAIPNRIADELTDSMIDVMKVTADGLAVGGTLVRTMGGSYGITNSVYDLRELV